MMYLILFPPLMNSWNPLILTLLKMAKENSTRINLNDFIYEEISNSIPRLDDITLEFSKY